MERKSGSKVYIIVKEVTSLKQFPNFSLGWNFTLKFKKKKNSKNMLLGEL